MFRFRKQLISLICAFAVLCCALPVYSSAEEAVPAQTTEDDFELEEEGWIIDEEEPEIEEYVEEEELLDGEEKEEWPENGEMTEEAFSDEEESEDELGYIEFPEDEFESEEFAEEASEKEAAEEEADDWIDTEESAEDNPESEPGEMEPATDYNESEQAAENDEPEQVTEDSAEDFPGFLDINDTESAPGKGSVKAPAPVVAYRPNIKKPAIIVTWTDSTANFKNVSTYQLQRRTDSGKWVTVATRKPSSHKPAGKEQGRFEYYDYTFIEGHVYAYRVRNIKSGKVEAVSAVRGASTLKMSKLTVNNTIKGYPQIEWTKVPRATGYFVYRKQSTQDAFSSKPYKTITQGSTTTFTDIKVSDGIIYSYLVVPFRKAKENRYTGSNSNTVKFKYNVEAMLKTPTIMKTAQNNDVVKIQWDKISGATKYEIYIKEAGAKGWTLAGTVEGGSRTSFTHQKKINKKNGGHYIQYRVRALGNSRSRSELSKAVKVFRLGSPENLRLGQSVIEDRVIVQWGKVAGAEEYHVYFRQTGAEKYKVMKVSGEKTKAALSVTGTKEYEVYVQAAGKGIKSQRTEIKRIAPYWYYVYIVGESDYSRVRGCENLSSPEFDLPALKTLFGKQTNNIRTSLNASQTEVYNGITSAFGNAGPNSVCIFVWIGHGVVQSGEKYAGALCTTDGKYIRPAELKKHMDSKLKSNHVVILLGSCGSGAFIHHTKGTDITIEENTRADTATEASVEEIMGALIKMTVNTEAEVDPEAEPEFDADAEVEEFNSNFISAFRNDENANKAGEFNNSRKYTIISGAEVDEAGNETSWRNRFSMQLVNARNNPIHALCRAGGYEYCNNEAQHIGWVDKKGDSNNDNKISLREAYQYARTLISSHMQFWSSEPNLILFQ